MRVSMGTLHATSNLDKLAANIQAKISPLIHETVESLIEQYKQSILTGLRTGKVYKLHHASAPGEPPAKLSGDLIASITAVYKSDVRGEMHVDAHYARMLEFGTKRMAARPSIRPIMEQLGPQYRKALGRILRQAIKETAVK